ncbi:cobalt-precorrin 5A hydrolase [Acidovorax soli]|uniref:Cobalt-precorrin 5A hydrolase n=1 Tax=Acidovorax soli TaxID=592050 RepID=A0A7X0PD86_9BURK|nr:cobalamin biosynthesis protein [Acidovorax soli]MBB6559778.1 cobalt-precorrin 5A hydrolase [Acidovorax soli]
MTASTPGHACLVLGVGLRAHATAATLRGLWQQAKALLPAPADGFCSLAVLEGKEQHPALAGWRVPVLALPLESLRHQPVATQSARLIARYGTGSVAEAAALAAAGPQAQLLLPRRVAQDGSATLAVARRRVAPLDCCIAAACRAAALSQGATAP